MLRRIAFCLCLAASLATAAVWPDSFAGFERTSVKPPAVADRALWEEYGFSEGEAAEYVSGQQRFTAVFYRFNDPTGAFSGFQALRPPGARPSSLGPNAAETPGAVWLVFGNYLLQFDGRKPSTEELTPLLESLPLLDHSSLPSLTGHLPEQGLVPNSQRFILGPASLEKFEPRIPPSVAAFHLGAEGQLARYQTAAGEIALTIFSYPTPQIAREQVLAFQKVPGAMAKRSGLLVAVVISPADLNEAERILSRVRYHATISWSEYVPTERDNVGNLILTAFALTGLLLAFAIVAGLAFGGVRFVARFWLGREQLEEPMITLNLKDK